MKKTTLDATDIRILSAAQKYGRLSKSQLAKIVNLSPTPCWTRLTKLRDAGLIRSYHADIALDRIVDFTKVIMTISLLKHQKSDFDKFENYIKQINEITECIATGGGTDYVLKVITPNLEDFQSLMERLLLADLSIDRYMTYIVTREIKASKPDLMQLYKT